MTPRELALLLVRDDGSARLALERFEAASREGFSGFTTDGGPVADGQFFDLVLDELRKMAVEN